MSAKQKLLLLILGLPALLGLALWGAAPDLGFAGTLLRIYTLACLSLVVFWLLTQGFRFFLWRVSRRLAFSYFLIGIVPIPLVATLVLVAAYISGGFFMAHLYRDGLAALSADLELEARRQLTQLQRGGVPRWRPPVPIALAYYRDGRRVAGDRGAPAVWQSWWSGEEPGTAVEAQLVATADGSPTLMTALTQDRYGVLALYAGDLGRELSERSGIWVELFRSDDPRQAEAAKIRIGSREVPIEPPHRESSRGDLRDFFHPGVEEPGLFDRPSLVWAERSRSFLDLATGSYAARHVTATLTATPRAIYFYLVPGAAEVDFFALVIFVVVIFLLFDIYVAAALMALLLISGLSRAVNLLTDATRKVQQGDFSARIEVERQDQLGALQESFNQMTANLGELVSTAAQKEILEKELSIAQALQRSLLPGDGFEAPEPLRFATHFSPSTAIGGDYYDLLPLADGRLAIVVADVSGHGLPAGLKMAMVKSALQLLSEEESCPRTILERLHRLLRDRLRTSTERHGFVTATLSTVDCGSGELVITNAGHPPTYLLRDGEVREILLPSPPLGSLGGELGQQVVQLVPGDIVVWLSDGLIEATGAHQEAFGYERIAEVLAGLDPEPETVRDGLLAAVARHTGGGTVDDDQTLVVMAYRPPDPGASAS